MSKLDKLINSAKDQGIPPFPFSGGQLRGILEKVDNSLSANKPNNSLLRKGAFKMGILGVFLTGVACLFLMFNAGDNNKPGVGQTVSSAKKQATGHGQVIEKKTGNTPGQKASGNKSTQQEPKNVYSFEVSLSGSIDTVKSSERLLSLFTRPHEKKYNIPLLVLDDNELKKINIFRSDNGFLIAGESFYGSTPVDNYPDQLPKMGYPDKGIYHDLTALDTFSVDMHGLLKYEGWDMEKSAGIYPVEMSFRYKNKKRHGGGVGCFGYTAVLDSNVKKYYREELRSINTFLLKYFSEQVDFNSNPNGILQTSQLEKPLSKNFLPVILRLGSDTCGMTAIVWYPRTKAFVSLLPERYRRDINDNIITDNLVRDEILSAGKPLPDYNKDTDEKKFSDNRIDGIERLILTEEELKKLDIYLKDNKYTFLSESRLDTNTIDNEQKSLVKLLKVFNYPETNPLLVKSKVQISYNSISANATPYNGWDCNKWSKTVPVYATALTYNVSVNTDSNRYRKHCMLTWHSEYSPLLDSVEDKSHIVDFDKGKFKPRIDHLLPVRVTLGDSTGKDNSGTFTELDIWFYVTKEFAGLLPERYKTPILNELDIIQSVEEGKLVPEEACVALKGEKSYFDLCRQAGSNIKDVILAPNPVTDKSLKINFMLANSSVINIDLYDFSGRFIQSIMKDNPCAEGLNSHSVTLTDNVSEGIYLISITDDKGGQVVQKLVVRK